MLVSSYIRFFPIVIIFLTVSTFLEAQEDSAKVNTIDSILMKPKGLLGQITQALLTDTTDDGKDLQRNDLRFQRYEGRFIRNIIVVSPKFGVQTNDTIKGLDKKLTRLANKIHYRSRGWVIRNHLFFKPDDKLSAYKLGNNERYLRDLPFLQEASIYVAGIKGSPDSVDVIVRTKDVLSIGGSITLRNTNSARIEFKEDNLMGWGDRLQFSSLFDHTRTVPFGIGMEYIKRNILGSFIDGSVGYVNFDNAFNTGRREEKQTFARLIKPLVNPYMRWTYAVTAEMHNTANMYGSDSLYEYDWRYKYRTYDAWTGYNLSANNTFKSNEFNRLRFLLSTRVFDQKFIYKPIIYLDKYNYAYANSFAWLGAISIFKLNYYRTQYVYGFGRKEDLPNGLEASITSGFTRKENRERLYTALNFQRYYLTAREGYFNYSFSMGSYFYQKKAEDISMLAGFDYFTRLRYMGARWKQRAFFNASFGRQFRSLLEEPLLLESRYGLKEFRNNHYAGSMRGTIKAESVFFSPWSVLFFRFAPFVFSSATVFRVKSEGGHDTKLYTAIGGGVRTRNESLIFGTIELRAVYFPRKDMLNNSYVIQLNTNLRYKYTQNFIKRPEFVQVN